MAASSSSTASSSQSGACHHVGGEDDPKPKSGSRSWTKLPGASLHKLVTVARRQSRSESSLSKTEPVSSRQWEVSGTDSAVIQLEEDDVGKQISSLFETNKDPAAELLSILKEPGEQDHYGEDEVVQVLVEGVRAAVHAAKGDRVSIFEVLAELSNSPISHHFLTELGEDIEDRALLCESITAVHQNLEGLPETLSSFA